MTTLRFPLALALLAFVPTAGCLGADTDGEDGDATDKANACDVAHGKWLIEKYAPLLCEDGPACVGQVALSTQPSCEGGPSYSVWSSAYEKHVLYPWSLRHSDALNAFVDSTSVDYANYAQFLSQIAPIAEERAAHEALIALQGKGTVDGYQEWLDSYTTVLHQFAFPLRKQSNIDSDARLVCGTPWTMDDSCGQEPALYLNAEEHAFLSMFEATMPKTNKDGAAAHWASFYNSQLVGPDLETGTQFVFPSASDEGLSDYELAYFERIRGVQPESVGDADDQQWIFFYLDMISVADYSDSDSVLRLDLYAKSLPSQLSGLDAYRTWLGVSADGGIDYPIGFSYSSTIPQSLERLKQVKPCAKSATELQKMETVFATFAPPGPTADIVLAKPVACSGE